jgi:hypothetical protein
MKDLLKIRKSFADGSLVVGTSSTGFVENCGCWKENSDQMRSEKSHAGT